MSLNWINRDSTIFESGFIGFSDLETLNQDNLIDTKRFALIFKSEYNTTDEEIHFFSALTLPVYFNLPLPANLTIVVQSDDYIVETNESSFCTSNLGSGMYESPEEFYEKSKYLIADASNFDMTPQIIYNNELFNTFRHFAGVKLYTFDNLSQSALIKINPVREIFVLSHEQFIFNNDLESIEVKVILKGLLEKETLLSTYTLDKFLDMNEALRVNKELAQYSDAIGESEGVYLRADKAFNGNICFFFRIKNKEG